MFKRGPFEPFEMYVVRMFLRAAYFCAFLSLFMDGAAGIAMFIAAMLNLVTALYLAVS